MSPEATRLGAIPDAGALQPADILLVSSAQKNLASLAIRGASPLLQPEKWWTHAALHIGRGKIIEATLVGRTSGHVRAITIDAFADREFIVRGRTLDGVNVNHEVVIAQAQRMLGVRYSVLRAAKAAVPTLVTVWKEGQRDWRTERPFHDGMICTDVVHAAYAEAGVHLLPGKKVADAFTPSVLRQSPKLQWASLVRCQLP